MCSSDFGERIKNERKTLLNPIRAAKVEVELLKLEETAEVIGHATEPCITGSLTALPVQAQASCGPGISQMGWSRLLHHRAPQNTVCIKGDIRAHWD